MISIELWKVITITIPILLIEGFFSGSEIALLSAEKIELKKQAQNGSTGARFALGLISHPEKLLATTLAMTSSCVIAISSLVAIYFFHITPENGGFLAIAVTSPVVVIFGEFIPKTIFQRYSLRLAPIVAYPVQWAYVCFYPITRLLTVFTSQFSRLISPMKDLIAGKKRTTRDELISMISYNKNESEIRTSEKNMIKRILDFKDTEAKNAQIPLVEVDAIEDNATVEMALNAFHHHRHSRMPVYSERIDNIIGVLEISSLLTAQNLDHPITGYLRSPQFAAETQVLQEVLMEMHRSKNEMTVVVDEHGGAVGILTFEDIVEEIVGEINDEFDHDLFMYKEIEKNNWLVQARMEIDNINELLKLELPEGEYETLSGFLLQQFGRIPEVKDELYFNTPVGSLKFTVQRATKRRIETVLIAITPQSDDQPPEA